MHFKFLVQGRGESAHLDSLLKPRKSSLVFAGFAGSQRGSPWKHPQCWCEIRRWSLKSRGPRPPCRSGFAVAAAGRSPRYRHCVRTRHRARPALTVKAEEALRALCKDGGGTPPFRLDQSEHSWRIDPSPGTREGRGGQDLCACAWSVAVKLP